MHFLNLLQSLHVSLISELIDELNCCWRESKSKDKPDINDGHWGCLSKQAKEILVKLDLATDINEEISREHKKPGAKTKSTILQPAQYSNVAPVRSRGRPRKEVDPNELNKPKRPRGRPRKEVDPNELSKPKRPRGRPRKEVDPNELSKPKRPRGRPRKEIDPNELSKPKRPRGRPRKEIDPNR